MLKQLLQLLLNTRTTPEEAAHSAMPSDTYTRLVDNGTIGSEWTAQAFSGIAAYDGYLFFAGTSTSAVPIVGIATAGCASNLTFPWEGARLATTIPIAKGQTWTVQGSSLKDVIIDLSKTVSLGGGYNSFVWRALSCLRALSNYLQRGFCKINIQTSLINADQVPVHKARQSQETARRISWLHSQVGQSLRLAQTVRQTTHGLGLKTPPEELHTSPMQFANTKRLLSQCKKEIFLLLTSALITRTKALFCLSLLKQQNNFGTGGVTC